MLESVDHCPLCQSTGSQAFDQRRFRDQQVTNRLCSSCGLVYQSPRMSDHELELFYEEEYRQLYQGSQGPNPKDLAIQRGRAAALLSFSRPFLTTVNRHLDIGCSAGSLLLNFQGVYHCQSVGIEPGTAYREYALDQGLKVYGSPSEMENQDEGRFDLISLAHVLEHIPNPVDYLVHLRQGWLEPGGWLLLEVPNLYGHDCFEVAHTVSYSPHTLEQVLRQAGFQVLHQQVHGQPRSQVIPLYITVLAQRQPEGKVSSGSQSSHNTSIKIQPEKGVSMKRRYAMLRRQIITRLMPSRAWLPLKH